jgi:pyruvate formate lyase activating enzyme
MIVKGIQKLTLIDYPGHIACTIFTFGCNFRCPFCYNRSLVIDDSTPAIPMGEVFDFLSERREFLEGVVVCGGEPCIHSDLPDFIAKVKRMGFLVKLDTNGTNPSMLEDLIHKNLLDYVAMDIKAPWQKYEQVVKVRVKLKDIKQSFNLVVNSGIDHEVRTTVVPKIHTEKDVVRIAHQVRKAKRYFLQQFAPLKTLDPSFMRVKPFSLERLKRMQEKCNRYLPTALRI